MKRPVNILIAGVALLGLTGMVYATPTITVTIPKVIFNTGDTSVDTELNTLFAGPDIITAKAAMEEQANEAMAQFGSQELLGQGFGNSNAYSAQSGTLQGYQGYKLFAVMGGFMVGAQLPSFDLDILMSIPDTIVEKPDVYAGVAPSVGFNIGLNAGGIFGFFNKKLGNTLKPFYFNVKYAPLTLTTIVPGYGDIDVSSTNFAIGLNYQWIPQSKSVLLGLFKWRGVNVGSGFNYQSNSVQFSTNLDKISQPFSAEIPIAVGEYTAEAPVAATFTATPTINLGIDMSTFSIPLELSTSVQFLWLLNLNLGAGADLVFGNTDITVNANSDFSVEKLSIDNRELDASKYKVTPGNVALDAGTKNVPPSLARMRIMAGIGVQLGPIKIDLPLYYYLNSGLAAGVSVGIVW